MRAELRSRTNVVMTVAVRRVRNFLLVSSSNFSVDTENLAHDDHHDHVEEENELSGSLNKTRPDILVPKSDGFFMRRTVCFYPLFLITLFFTSVCPRPTLNLFSP